MVAARGGGSPVESAPPARIGAYAVEATLGRGGMGKVYRVRDAGGRRLALKIATIDDKAARLRFRREFHTMASLRHPRIVEVFDYGVDGGTPYYTMELLDGEDLADLDRVPWLRAVELLRDVASALAFLHARRLLHRDLAPRNVRCTNDGRAKLIDFGVLATAGVVGEIAGTPPFMAPEGLHGQPLDHRYDLFGLGALAYRIITGKHAYPARTLEQLEQVWRNKPVRTRELAPDVPRELDELIHALLAHEPLARPTGAAEVVDRLTVIGGLVRVPDTAVSHGWIASTTLVGRKREMAQVRAAVERARAGRGRSLLIEAPSGAGKTRLLRELALEAQLAGMTVVRAEPAIASGPYGVVRELARGLLATLPEASVRAARTGGSERPLMLARVIHELVDRLGVTPARQIGDPAEDRMRLQQELASWLLDIARLHPLVLCVDDVQRCDEASAAVLATLGHDAAERGLLLACALRVDEPVRAAAPIASLCDAGQRLRVRGLDEGELAELCASMFGDASHIPRFARWLHQAIGGSPLHVTELIRFLVDRGTIRFVDGIWVLPEEMREVALPSGLAEALDTRVQALPDEVRALGEVMAVHGGELPLELVVRLAETEDESAAFRALDRLAFEEILVHAGDRWRFRHDGLREAMLRGMSADRRRALHLRIGEALVASANTSAERDAEIGWHLHHGGDRRRGARLLERAGRALYDAQSFADSIPLLEAALAAIDESKGSARVRLELLHMLLMAGCMADRKTAMRYARDCVYGFRYWSGVDIADRARGYVGRYVAVALGLACATLRWVFSPRRGPNPYEAFRTFFIVVGYAATMHSLSFDFAGTQQLVRLVEPIAILRRRIPYAVYLLTRNTLHFPRGEVGLAEQNCRRILEIVERDRLTPIREIDRRTGAGGALYMLALSNVMNLTPTLTRDLEELRHLGLTFFDIGADQAMVVYHRVRGEEELAKELAARVELRFVQLGSLWQMEAFMPVIASLAYAFVRDTLALRRTIEQLATMCEDGYGYEGLLDLARGEYLLERGDLAGSIKLLEPIAADDTFPMIQIAALCALSESLLGTGELARAREVAARCVAISTDPRIHNYHGEVRSTRALALAEAALGDLDGATSRLDTAIANVAGRESPLLTGCLHEARARIALASGDTRVYKLHLAVTERLFHSTRNPVLIARAARLADELERPQRRLTTGAEPATQVVSPRASPSAVNHKADVVPTPLAGSGAADHGRSRASLESCRGSTERAQRALQVLVEETGGVAGYLYLRRRDRLELAAPTFGDEPPSQLAQALASLLDDPESPAQLTEASDESGAPIVGKPFALVLRLPDPFVVGGVLVLGGALPIRDPSPALLDEVAQALFEAGDITSVGISPHRGA